MRSVVRMLVLFGAPAVASAETATEPAPLASALDAPLEVFVARKVGFDEPGAGAWTGAVEVADIGVPRAVLDEVA